MKIYVASSWRNEYQQEVVKVLREAGHEVYDFKNPAPGNHGFHWSEIDPNWKKWNKETYRNELNHPLAERGYWNDFTAMQEAEVFVGVMPFGRSASMEMGWAAGRGRRTILLLENGEPELMVKMFHHICCSLGEVLEFLQKMENEKKEILREYFSNMVLPMPSHFLSPKSPGFDFDNDLTN